MSLNGTSESYKTRLTFAGLAFVTVSLHYTHYITCLRTFKQKQKNKKKKKKHKNRGLVFPTRLHVRQWKTQISLRIRTPWVAKDPKCLEADS